MMSLCHFDIPANNYKTIKKFYGDVFGWTFEKDVGSPDTWAIRFGAEVKLSPITGRIIPKSAPNQPIGCHFLVSSIEEASIQIQELGGAVFVPKTAVPGQGFYACCLDPEDNYLIIWENNEKAE